MSNKNDKTPEIISSIEQLREAVGEEKAEEILQRMKDLIEGVGDSSKVRCHVVIDFEAPSAVLGQAACAYLKNIVGDTIASAKWGDASFQSAVLEPLKEGEKHDTTPSPAPTSPLN
jgi:hypothetical protein